MLRRGADRKGSIGSAWLGRVWSGMERTGLDWQENMNLDDFIRCKNCHGTGKVGHKKKRMCEHCQGLGYVRR